MKFDVLILAFVTTFMFALWGIFGKIATAKIGLQVVLWAQITSFTIYIVYLTITKQIWPIKIDQVGILFGFLSGITVAGAVVMYYMLLDRQPAGIVAALTSLYPAITLALGYFFLKEQVSPVQLLGIGLALVAMFLISR
jgi:uncharacterized membrane protein